MTICHLCRSPNDPTSFSGIMYEIPLQQGTTATGYLTKQRCLNFRQNKKLCCREVFGKSHNSTMGISPIENTLRRTRKQKAKQLEMWFQPPIPLLINNSSHTSEVQRWCVSLPTPHVWFASNQFSFIRRAKSQPQLPEGGLHWKRKCWTDETAEKRRILQTQLGQFVNCQTKKKCF